MAQTGNQEELQKMKIEQRQQAIYQRMENLEKFKYCVIDHNFNFENQEIDCRVLFSLLWSDKRPYQGHNDFIEYIKKGLFTDFDYTATPFEPPIPEYFTDLNQTEFNILNFCETSERTLAFIHPLPKSNIPLMPKQANIKEVIKVSFISNNTIILNNEVYTSGVPKGETFLVRIRQIFQKYMGFWVNINQYN
ncbi:hypothetical protein IMG5_051680 [Ichthyophthirius multifiliis]|uniref:Uncharacterized protein n=1 Tax=Ichthyophthirius multifiliis TaxID=5932 RepID=G0QMT7_ICHMU|nr:hypothetical protein IMG5_051680 [Ichthyophthirius multifiliis]EGR33490.1 hypothetical protein IMG5_051680 [Ichthyophthirius multifiliis]|eukprot:XP_004037476.1 hypothetical protein IMG5_051680 [Ichthyophthirius multifiliis]